MGTHWIRGRRFAALLLALLLLTLTGCSGGAGTGGEETDVVASGVLSKERLHDWVNPQSVETLVFLDTLETAPEGAVDLSAAGDGSVRGWMDVTVLFLAGEGGVTAPENSNYLFSVWQAEKGMNASQRWDRLRTVDGASLLHMENTVSACSMFNYCESLTELDLSGWDVSNVRDMSGMFLFCRSLERLDLSGWNTASAENLDSMFCYCSALTSLNLSGWNTSHVTDVRNLFYNCASLRELDVSGWDTGRVRQNGYAFTGTQWEGNPPF